MIQITKIYKRIYSTVSVNSGFYFPRCINCVHFIHKKSGSLCLKYKCLVWVARSNPNKCGFFANGFEYR